MRPSAKGRRLSSFEEVWAFEPKTRELARSTLTATFFARLNRTAQRVLNITGSLRPLKIVHARAEARGAALCALLRRRHEPKIEVDVGEGADARRTGRFDAGAARAAYNADTKHR